MEHKTPEQLEVKAKNFYIKKYNIDWSLLNESQKLMHENIFHTMALFAAQFQPVLSFEEWWNYTYPDICFIEKDTASMLFIREAFEAGCNQPPLGGDARTILQKLISNSKKGMERNTSLAYAAIWNEYKELITEADALLSKYNFTPKG